MRLFFVDESRRIASFCNSGDFRVKLVQLKKYFALFGGVACPMVLKILGRLLVVLVIISQTPWAIGQEFDKPPPEDLQQPSAPQKALQEDLQEADVEKQAKLISQIKPVEIKPNDGDLSRLMKERFNTAIEVTQLLNILFEGGSVTFDQVMEAGKMVIVSGLDLFEDRKERIALLRDYLAVAKMYEAIAEKGFRASSTDKDTMLKATYHRLEVEILMLKETKQVEAKAAK